MCLGFIKQMFERVRERPFETEFKDCGFEMSEGPGGETAVRVLGHEKLLSVVIVGERITGHMDNLIDRDWWSYRVKKTKDERVLIQQMTRTFEGRKFTLKFSYSRIKGVFMPKKFNSMVSPESTGWPVFGVLEFSLKRPKVTVQKG